MASSIEELLRCDNTLQTLPAWLWCDTLARAALEVQQMGSEYTTLLCRLQQYLNTGPDGDTASLESELSPCLLPKAQVAEGSHTEAHLKPCVARIAFGAMLERLACHLWRRTKRLDRRARLMHLSYMVSWWTSTHVEHLLLLSHGNKYRTEPNIMNVPAQGNACSLDHVLDQRVVCGSSCRGTNALHQMLVRCTNPATRGWTSMIHGVVEQQTGGANVLRHALFVCLCGLHANLAPTDRPSWQTRARTLWRLQRSLTPAKFASFVSKYPEVIKEAVRRRLVDTLESSPALRHVMAKHGSVIANIGSPPRASPSNGTSNSMALMAQAGRMYAQNESANLKTVFRDVFYPHARSEQWLGKVLVKHGPVTLVTEAIEVFKASFHSHWNAFWMFAAYNHERPSRLDKYQFDAMHSVDPAILLCRAIDKRISLCLQRLVLQTPRLGALACQEMCELLSHRDEHREVSLRSNLTLGDATLSAMLVDAARTIWLCEQLFVVDLGSMTRRTQSVALLEKYRGFAGLATNGDVGCESSAASNEVLDGLLSKLPAYHTNICVCCACKRITNSMLPVHSRTKNSIMFDEVGSSSTMISTTHMTSTQRAVDMCCAKRSSAALRSATLSEMHASVVRVDTAGQGQAVQCMSVAQRLASTTCVATPMRRDGRRVHEQRREALACGDTPLVTVPLIGRVVRIYGAWYAMCSVCCAATRVFGGNRIGAEIVCVSCFTKSITETNDEPIPESIPVALLGRDRRCRFCAKLVSAGAGNFVSYASPRDTFGSNRELPSDLRVTWWCHNHQRHWVGDALLALDTAVILSHISMRANPVYATCSKHALLLPDSVDTDDHTAHRVVENLSTSTGTMAQRKRQRVRRNTNK